MHEMQPVVPETTDIEHQESKLRIGLSSILELMGLLNQKIKQHCFMVQFPGVLRKNFWNYVS